MPGPEPGFVDSTSGSEERRGRFLPAWSHSDEEGDAGGAGGAAELEAVGAVAAASSLEDPVGFCGGEGDFATRDVGDDREKPCVFVLPAALQGRRLLPSHHPCPAEQGKRGQQQQPLGYVSLLQTNR